MYKEITDDIEIKKGDWIRNKSTGELCQIGNLIDGRYEIRPNGRSTLQHDGVLFVGDRATIAKKYEFRID